MGLQSDVHGFDDDDYLCNCYHYYYRANDDLDNGN